MTKDPDIASSSDELSNVNDESQNSILSEIAHGVSNETLSIEALQLPSLSSPHIKHRLGGISNLRNVKRANVRYSY